MATPHRPLVTSVVAGGLLCALWFVPSANASYEADERSPSTPSSPSRQADDEPTGWGDPAEDGTTEEAAAREPAAGETAGADTDRNTQGENGDGPHLANTGSFDTTPYVAGGVTFLALGSGLIAHSIRRGKPQEA